MAERVGFEPTAPFGVTGFQDQLLKPLGHLSMSDTCKNRRGVFIGDPSEIRTPDTLIKSQVLCRLSYWVTRGWGSKIRTYECWDQNPVPYRLAIPQKKW